MAELGHEKSWARLVRRAILIMNFIPVRELVRRVRGFGLDLMDAFLLQYRVTELSRLSF